MAVDVLAAADKVETGELEEYYGFDPDSEYVIRTKNRDYQGTTLKYYPFVAGQVIAGRMRADATEEQKWNRGERLSWFLTASGYVIYLRGQEPSRKDEPLWSHLPPEESLETGEEDTGEIAQRATWPAAPEKNNPRQTKRAPRLDAQGRPVTSYPVANEGASGEAAPTPEVKTTRTSAKARATATPKTEPLQGGEEPSAGGESGPSFKFPQA